MKQCKTCPWLKCANPRDIPNGYCEEKHKKLKSTIATGTPEKQLSSNLRIMVCHKSKINEETPCVGWLHNQLGVGNNLQLRLWAMKEDLEEIELIGNQHLNFNDTLPREASL